MNRMADDRPLNTSEFAKLYGVGRRTVAEWLRDGKIPGAFRTPGGYWRIPNTAQPPKWENA